MAEPWVAGMATMSAESLAGKRAAPTAHLMDLHLE